MAGSDNPIDVLPEGWTPLGYAIAVKALNEYGEVVIKGLWDGVTPWEAVGMLTSFLDDLRDSMRAPMQAEGDD